MTSLMDNPKHPLDIINLPVLEHFLTKHLWKYLFIFTDVLMFLSFSKWCIFVAMFVIENIFTKICDVIFEHVSPISQSSPNNFPLLFANLSFSSESWICDTSVFSSTSLEHLVNIITIDCRTGLPNLYKQTLVPLTDG